MLIDLKSGRPIEVVVFADASRFTLYDGREDAGGCGGEVTIRFSDGCTEVRVAMLPSMVTELISELSGLFVKETSAEDDHSKE